MPKTFKHIQRRLGHNITDVTVCDWLLLTYIYTLCCFLQNNHMQRALFQQVSPCKPCADPHMNLPEKGATQTRWRVQ